MVALPGNPPKWSLPVPPGAARAKGHGGVGGGFALPHPIGSLLGCWEHSAPFPGPLLGGPQAVFRAPDTKGKSSLSPMVGRALRGLLRGLGPLREEGVGRGRAHTRP